MKYPEKESSTLEFKREMPKNDQVVKTVIGFCNRYGGQVIIGIEDDGTIVGIDDAETEVFMEYAEKKIYEGTAPPILPLVYTRQLAGKTILIIEVSNGMNKPYYRLADGIANGTYIRMGGSTQKANAEMIEELKWQSRGKDFEQLPVHHATIADIDNTKVEQFLRNRLKGQKISVAPKSDEALLLSYKLITKEHNQFYPTISGLLLFGHQPQAYLSDAIILCNRFSGIEGRRSIVSHDCDGVLSEQFEKAYQFIISQLDYSSDIEETKRKEELDIPLVVIREALLNAIIHRNYHIKSPIKIAIYDNRIEIVSPGNFSGPLNPDNLRQGMTFLRNPVICKIFREMDYVEKLGSGIITIYDTYEKAGLQSPEIIESDTSVKYILPRKSDVDKLLNVQEESLAEIMRLFNVASEISISEVIEACHLSRATAGRRLASLVKQGLIQRHGKGSNVRYRIRKNE